MFDAIQISLSWFKIRVMRVKIVISFLVPVSLVLPGKIKKVLPITNISFPWFKIRVIRVTDVIRPSPMQHGSRVMTCRFRVFSFVLPWSCHPMVTFSDIFGREHEESYRFLFWTRQKGLSVLKIFGHGRNHRDPWCVEHCCHTSTSSIAEPKRSAPRGIRTHDTRFKVWGANHYTMGAGVSDG